MLVRKDISRSHSSKVLYSYLPKKIPVLLYCCLYKRQLTNIDQLTSQSHILHITSLGRIDHLHSIHIPP
jgi:hypothetical protein